MTNKSIIALTLTALSLVPAACTVETSNKDATGGSSDTGGSESSGGTVGSGGTNANGGTTTVAGSSSTAGSVSAAGSAGVPSGVGGSATTAGAANSAGNSGVAGSSTGVAGSLNVAGLPGTAGTTSAAGTAGTAGAAGNSGVSCPLAPTPVDVTSSISTPTTWTADHVYVIDPSSTIYVSATLTIQPCTVVKFGADSRLYVQSAGQLNALGAAGAPIVFTSLKDDSAGGDTNGDGAGSQPGVSDWAEVTVMANGSKFDFVQLRYSDAGLVLSGANQSVTHSTFTSNNFALDATGVPTANAANTVITSNVLYLNTHPLGIRGGVPIDATNLFHNPASATQINTFQSIDVIGSGFLNTAVTWSNTEVAYSLVDSASSYYITAPGVLTLASGVVVKVESGSDITVLHGASLAGVATATFTSYKDDTKLGDSNGDAAATTPAASDWDGIRVITSSTDTWLSGTNILYSAH